MTRLTPPPPADLPPIGTDQQPRTNRGGDAGVSMLSEPYCWLARATQHAQDALKRGYVVRLQLMPDGVQVVVRVDCDGQVYEGMRGETYENIHTTSGKCLVLAIERVIAEAESYVFGMEYLPKLQAKSKHAVENACFFFYKAFDIPLAESDSDNELDWPTFAERYPQQANSLRRAMKSAMRGGRRDIQPG